MRRQTRPFTVEVKQKRGHQKRNRSIWGDIDLPGLAAETAREFEKNERQNAQLIDSSLLPIDADSSESPSGEHLMADPQEAQSVQTATEAPAKAEVSEQKKKAPRPRKAKAQPKRPAESDVAKQTTKAAGPSAAAARTGRKIYSEMERALKLGQIEQSISRGSSIKSAVGQAGISEQTYYQWKKAAAPSPSQGDDLKDLVALEEENARLKKLLAERLRNENAELKKKLGLN
jgi:hypothetical protein